MTIPDFPTPPAVVRRRKTWPWVVAIVSAGIIASTAAVVVMLSGNHFPGSQCADPSETAPCPGPDGTWISADGSVRPNTGPATPTAPVPTYTEPVYPIAEPPSTSDFSVDLKTISKQCFGSAGCNVVVEPQLDYSGPASDLDAFSCDITYSITGDDSGEVVETARGNGGTSYQVSESMLSTRSSKTTVTAKVTDVSCR